jgi:CysZ protein
MTHLESRSFEKSAGSFPRSSDKVGFIGGFIFLWRGLRFVYAENRELARFYIPPMIVGFLLVLGAWVCIWTSSDEIANYAWKEPEPELFWGLAHAAWRIVSMLVGLLLALLVLVVSSWLFAIVVAPLSDLISERVESIRGTWVAKPFSFSFLMADVIQTVRFETTRLVLKLLWFIPLFLLSFVPVVGQGLYFILGGYILSKYTGMDYVDWCAARRGWSWKERFAFAKQNRWALSGFGTAVLLSLMIPFAFALIWPGAVAGGTILFTRLHNLEVPGNVPGNNLSPSSSGEKV